MTNENIELMQAAMDRVDQEHAATVPAPMREQLAEKPPALTPFNLIKALELIRDMGHECPPDTDATTFYRSGLAAMVAEASKALEGAVPEPPLDLPARMAAVATELRQLTGSDVCVSLDAWNMTHRPEPWTEYGIWIATMSKTFKPHPTLDAAADACRVAWTARNGGGA